MLFNSLAYGLFLTIIFLVYWLIPHKYRWFLILVSSYYFYMRWNPKYILLIIAITVFSYIAGLMIEKSGSVFKKKIILAANTALSLGILFVFKYFDFFSGILHDLLGKVQVHIPVISLSLILPVGISFYTFQALSYVFDVYRGKIKAEKNLGCYAAFVSFFPQLVAGPIERTGNLLPQIKSEKKFDYACAVTGLRLMLLGYLKKVVIADTLSYCVDRVYGDVSSFTGFSLILAIVFFTIQIYCDFSGYSDIAVGSAKLLGINLMTNFKSPYFSSSVKEFWQRWHISLSTWFRDYVYIPLGGNRCSFIRNKINIIITFLLSGLWHGANVTFIIWGLLHGIGQIFSGIFPDKKKSQNIFVKIIKISLTFIFCNLAWVFFRAQNVNDALYVYAHLFDGINTGLIEYLHSGFATIGFDKINLMEMVIACFFIIAYDLIALKKEPLAELDKLPRLARWGIYVFIVLIIIFFRPVNNADTQFIYFQF